MLDIDNTLVHCIPAAAVPDPERMFAGLKFKHLPAGSVLSADAYVVLRPFVRFFLHILGTRCHSVALWTNGAARWADYVASTLFSGVDWHFVRDRRHSEIPPRQFSEAAPLKRLAMLFEDSSLPHSAHNTILVDDQVTPLLCNRPENIVSVRPFDATQPHAGQDDELMRVLGMLVPILKPVHVLTPADPAPRGMPNASNVCYANAVSQCLMRVPSVRERIGSSHEEWVSKAVKQLGSGMQDSSEALISTLGDLLYTPERICFKSAAAASHRHSTEAAHPVWLYTLSPTAKDRSVGECFLRELRWSKRDGEGARWRSEAPLRSTTALIFLVHRLAWDNTAKSVYLLRNKVLPTRTLATPVGTFGLRGVVFYSGRHYTAIFIRDDGTAWLANDEHVTNVTLHLDSLLEDRQHMAFLMFYDKQMPVN